MRDTTPFKISRLRIDSLLIILTHVAIGFLSAPAFAADGIIDPMLTDPRVFDADFYCKKYPDLASAGLCRGDRRQALREHWANLGIGEKRQAHPLFSVAQYLDRYPDLNRAHGDSPAGALRHYLRHGILEGRSGNPRGAKNWSNPDSWDTKAVPRAHADVLVQEDQNLLIDKNIEVGKLTILGSVTCAHQDLKIKARSIMVHGLLKCGVEPTPHNYQLEITLAGGNRSDDAMGMGTNVLGVMGGGILLLHGQERSHSWLMLDETAEIGAKTITLNAKTNWRIDDTILITPTRPFKSPAPVGGDQPWLEAETRTIVSIIDAHSRQKLVLDKPLEHRHFGERQTFKNGVPGDKGYQWVADTRAEVALLSRNIKIQGDPGLSNMNEPYGAKRLGAHVMSMKAGYSYISGVEFTNVGQEGFTARYPFHWHEAGDVSGQYIKNSSIHRSFNRCVTVHATNNALVENNVCYDHIGHGYFLEDGNETGNIFKGNLAALGKRPRKLADGSSMAILPTDHFGGQASKGPASFWISNADNTFLGNVGAGTEGTAFWYHTEYTVTGESAAHPEYENIKPRSGAFGTFKNNRAHSSSMALSTCLNEKGADGYHPPSTKPAFFENFTVYSAGIGAVWPCAGGNQAFHKLQVLDSGGNDGIQGALTAAGEALVRYSLFVANSKLQDGDAQARVAMGLYDFGVDFLWTHFENYTGQSVIARTTRPTIRRTDNTWNQVTLANSDNVLSAAGENAEQWGGVVQVTNENFAINGRTLGAGAFVSNIPLMKTGACRPVGDEGVFCKNQRYALLRFPNLEKQPGGAGVYPEIRHGRSDIDPKDHKVSMAGARYHNSVIAVSPDRPDFYYTYQFTQGLKPSLFDKDGFRFELHYANPDDIALFQIKGIKPTSSAGSVRVRLPGVVDFEKANSAEDLFAMSERLARTRTGGGYYYDAESESLLIMVRLLKTPKNKEWRSSASGWILF